MDNKIQSIYDMLCKLENINNSLLEILRRKSKRPLLEALEERTTISKKIENYCAEHAEIKIGDNKSLNEKSMTVLKQDEELMIYLEIQVQKLRGKYQRHYALNGSPIRPL